MVIVKSKYIVCVKKSRSTSSQYITFSGESNQYNTRRELVIVKQIDKHSIYNILTTANQTNIIHDVNL